MKPLLISVFCKCKFNLKTCNPKAHNSKKATKVCEISTVDMTITVTTQDKSTVKILLNVVAFSEYINFNLTCQPFLI